MSKDEIRIKFKDTLIGISKRRKLPDNMISDAFTALCISVLQEPMMSSDAKYFLLTSMCSNLETMGYSTEDMNDFKDSLNAAIKTFMTVNNFMG